ncbi:MAG TPA: hypothetical protein PKK43_16805 [Spirochaetota bacterium]|nr:hypothetical protein [Spirochaetota bacterium]
MRGKKFAIAVVLGLQDVDRLTDTVARLCPVLTDFPDCRRLSGT